MKTIPRSLWWTIGLAVLVLVGILNYKGRRIERGENTQRLFEAKQVTLALKEWAIDHEGRYPEKLADLVEAGLDPKLLDGLHLVPGLTDSDAGNLLLVYSDPNKDGDVIAIRNDGSGRQTRGEDLPALLAEAQAISAPRRGPAASHTSPWSPTEASPEK
ncbi:MAG: hypothetical protein R3F11_30050 [Verrucomicrobiales bacterium]